MSTTEGPPAGGPTLGPSPEAELESLVRRGAKWQLANIVFGRFGQFALGVVIARILSPDDFGVFAVALVVQAIVISLNELGVSNILVRGGESARTGAMVSSISLVNSVLLAGVMLLSSHQLAALLKAPSATSTLQVLSITVVLAGMGATPLALLRRDFRQDLLLRSDVLSTVVSSAVVIGLALLGWGPLALAWSRVAGQAVGTVVLIKLSPEPYRLAWDRLQLRRLLAFGLPLAAANAISWMVVNADYVVVGRLLGSLSLGYYLLAFNISGWPLTVFGMIVRSIALPTFGRLREDRSAIVGSVVTGARVVATVTFPVCFMLGALAVPLVHVVYGGRWHESAAPLAALSVFAAARGLLDLLTEFLIALDHTRAVLITQIGWLVVLAPTLVLGADRFGLAGVGAAQALVLAGFVIPGYLVLVRRLGVPTLAVVRACAPGLVMSLVAAAAGYAVTRSVDDPVLALLLGGLAGSAVYLAVMGRSLYAQVFAGRRRAALPASQDAEVVGV